MENYYIYNILGVKQATIKACTLADAWKKIHNDNEYLKSITFCVPESDYDRFLNNIKNT